MRQKLNYLKVVHAISIIFGLLFLPRKTREDGSIIYVNVSSCWMVLMCTMDDIRSNKIKRTFGLCSFGDALKRKLILDGSMYCGKKQSSLFISHGRHLAQRGG